MPQQPPFVIDLSHLDYTRIQGLGARRGVLQLKGYFKVGEHVRQQGWMARSIVQEKDYVSFLSFQTVVQPGKDSNHYLSSHPRLLIAEVLAWAPQEYDGFAKHAKQRGNLLLPITIRPAFSPSAFTKNAAVINCFAFLPPLQRFPFWDRHRHRLQEAASFVLIPYIPRWVALSQLFHFFIPAVYGLWVNISLFPSNVHLTDLCLLFHFSISHLFL